VVDESALTGESRPVEREAGDTVRSGTVNAASAFDLRATTTAAESSYAGIVRLVATAEASSGSSATRGSLRRGLLGFEPGWCRCGLGLGRRRTGSGRGGVGGRHAVPAHPAGAGGVAEMVRLLKTLEPPRGAFDSGTLSLLALQREKCSGCEARLRVVS
jgi:hypothetical protein